MHGRVPGAPDVRQAGGPAARAADSDDFDIVHDNQVLAYGMLDLAEMGFPLITSIHHPITFDRRIDLEAAPTRRKKLTLRRWYGFLRMQAKVARQVGKILTVSESSRHDIVKDFGVDDANIQVIPLGVDEVFRPADQAAGARADRRDGQRGRTDEGDRDPARGVRQAAHRARGRAAARHAPTPGGRTEQLIEHLGIGEHVSFVSGISDAELVEVMGSAEIACVPSLYEGFSLPTAELMACETPLVVSRAGAIPEVVGPDGLCADLVTPGRRGRARAGAAGHARRPRAPRPDGQGRPRAGAGEVQLAGGGRGHGGGVRRRDPKSTTQGVTHADR